MCCEVCFYKEPGPLFHWLCYTYWEHDTWMECATQIVGSLLGGVCPLIGNRVLAYSRITGHEVPAPQRIEQRKVRLLACIPSRAPAISASPPPFQPTFGANAPPLLCGRHVGSSVLSLSWGPWAPSRAGHGLGVARLLKSQPSKADVLVQSRQLKPIQVIPEASKADCPPSLADCPLCAAGCLLVSGCLAGGRRVQGHQSSLSYSRGARCRLVRLGP